jgi:hypothetical protein
MLTYYSRNMDQPILRVHLYKKTDHAGIQKARLGTPQAHSQLSSHKFMELWELVSWLSVTYYTEVFTLASGIMESMQTRRCAGLVSTSKNGTTHSQVKTTV